MRVVHWCCCIAAGVVVVVVVLVARVVCRSLRCDVCCVMWIVCCVLTLVGSFLFSDMSHCYVLYGCCCCVVCVCVLCVACRSSLRVASGAVCGVEC